MNCIIWQYELIEFLLLSKLLIQYMHSKECMILPNILACNCYGTRKLYTAKKKKAFHLIIYIFD